MTEAHSTSTSKQVRDSVMDTLQELQTLIARATALVAAIGQKQSATNVAAERATTLQFASDRLVRSVIRPLGAAAVALQNGNSPSPVLDCTSPGSGADEDLDIDGEVWELAQAITTLRARQAVPCDIQEAAAAVQDLTIRWAPEATARIAALQAIQTDIPYSITVSPNGPYLATNLGDVTDWLGVQIEARPQMAFCRCGASSMKPFCDGSHVDVAFRDTKDANRVADRRDVYVGQQVQILDNRGTCQHSGLCTDRLASVFRQGKEPFVAPSGGRMDEIIRAVRDCPSGALSFAIDDREAREQVDFDGKREPSVVITRDGPYRISGGIPLTDGDERDVPRNEGASHEHYALCRCGHSLNKPFCSGMHWYVNFHDPVPDPEHEPTVFEWCGGLPALTRMTRIFYEKYVPQDPLLAPIFANMAADHPQRVAAWLGEVFGGPKNYSEEYGGYPRMISQHIGKGITEEKRTRWATLLLAAANDAGIPNDPEFRSIFSSYIEWESRLAVENSTVGAHPPEHMPMPHWSWNTASGPPGSRVSAIAPQQGPVEAPIVLPTADEAVHFEKHIKPLFREQDRQSMEFAFDLWVCKDVSQNAPAILGRLTSGTMPCDGAWPKEKVVVFRRWVESGMAP